MAIRDSSGILVASSSSSAPTAATTGAATTPAACSGQPATAGTSQHRAAPPGWSSPTPRPGPADRSPSGRSAPPGHRPGYRPPRGRGIAAIPDDIPLTCWLPIKPGLTPHGMRHSHKTWMAEDGIPEILAEQRLGHEVPGMRGLYAHASDRMRDDLKAALQQRWEDSLCDRAAVHPHSPVPLLDKILAPHRGEALEACGTASHPAAPASTCGQGKVISQIPPSRTKGPIQTTRMEPVLRASDPGQPM